MQLLLLLERAAFTTSANDADITLTNGSNALNGTVTFTSTDTNSDNAEDVDFVNSVGVVLGGSTATGTLDVTASTGNITQTGALNVSGAASFITSADDADITLDGSNNFSDAVTFTSTDTNNDNTEEVTLKNYLPVILGGSTNSGTLTVYALQGNITQTGALDVDGVSSFRTYDDDADILLTNGSNALTGAVTFISDDTNGNNAEDIDFTNSVTVILGGGSNIGTLDVIASSGDITQSAALVVGGASTFRVANGSNITLGSANEFGSQVTFKAGAAGDQTFGNVTFRDDSAVKLDVETQMLQVIYS